MALAAEQELKHLGETSGCADHDHDLIHELSRRLDGLWRYDQYIANAAESGNDLQQFWRELKEREQQTVARLKQLLAKEVQGGCF